MKIIIHWIGDQYCLPPSEYEWVVRNIGNVLRVAEIELDENGRVDCIGIYQSVLYRDIIWLYPKNHVKLTLIGAVPQGQLTLGEFTMAEGGST